MKKVSTSANSALGLDLLRNVCPAEKRTKHSNILLLRLVRFSVGQTLGVESLLPFHAWLFRGCKNRPILYHLGLNKLLLKFIELLK